MIGGSILVGMLVIYCFGRWSGSTDTATSDPRIHTLNNFCTGTWLAMKEDAADLRNPSPKIQNAAFERFYDSTVMYHNAASVRMCVRHPLNHPDMCVVNKDLACLGKAAEHYAGLVVQELP